MLFEENVLLFVACSQTTNPLILLSPVGIYVGIYGINQELMYQHYVFAVMCWWENCRCTV